MKELDELSRQNNIISILASSYPQATIALNYSSPWELLVAVILSAQCTDAMVNKVTANLFVKYPTLAAYLAATEEEFSQDIKPTGFYRNKAKHILATAKIIRQKHQGIVPSTMEELVMLPGVARKTANVILQVIYNNVVGIVVDTHVSRISQRLRLVSPDEIGGKQKVLFQQGNTSSVLDYRKDAGAVKIEKALMETLPKSVWPQITFQLIEHGRAVCKAQNPRCDQCVLAPYCPVKRMNKNS